MRNPALDAWGDYDRDDPYPLFAQVQADGPVHEVTLADGHCAWLIAGHQEAKAALSHAGLSKDMHAALARDGAVVAEGLPGPAFARHMLSVDPPGHTRLRLRPRHRHLPPQDRLERVRRMGASRSARAVALEPSVWVWTAGRTTRAQCSRDPKWLAGGSTMTEGSGAKGDPHPFTDEARALGIDVDNPDTLTWMGEHLLEFRQQVSGQRPLYWILGIGFVVGLAAQIVGFLLKTSVTPEPLLLVADLLYALGWSLWTGVVVVFFVQIWPEAKRRQLKRWLDVYEAALREKARAGGDQTSGDDGAPTAR